MKKISLFALAFAVVGLSACAEEAADPAVEETATDAEVVTPVEPAEEMMDDAEGAMEDAAAEGEEMMDDAEAAAEEVEAEGEEMMEGEE
ncbi:MAG: hypothetical protein AAF791_14275 [Bacteroidota bacterium]